MKFYVLYESYYEYGMFDGSWEYSHSVFDDLESAKDFVERIIKDSDYRNVIGPLQNAS